MSKLKEIFTLILETVKHLFCVLILSTSTSLYTGELDKIEIDASDFDAGSSNVLVVSFTANGLTTQRSITFTGKCANTIIIRNNIMSLLNSEYIRLASYQNQFPTIFFIF